MQTDVSATFSLEAIADDARAVGSSGRFPRDGVDEPAHAGLLGLGLPESLGPIIVGDRTAA